MRLVRFGSSNPLFKSHNFSRRNIVMAITGDDHEEAEEKERFADLIHRLDDDAEYAHKHAKGFKRYFTASVILNVLIFVGAQLIGIYAWPLTDPPLQLAQMDVAAQALETNRPWYKGHGEAFSPSSGFEDIDFLRYSTWLLWLTVVLTGLGMELVIGEPLVKHLGADRGMQMWKAAQLFFSLSISVSLFSKSAFGLPFAVVGFWKFGFPETAGCFRRAFRIGKLNLDFLAAYMNGVGTLIHHASGAYLIVACTTHLMPLDRRVLSMSLPLVAQHLVVLVRYWNTAVYGICELALEIWWEWEIIGNVADLSVENGYDKTTRGICLSMIFAHWMYWGAALIHAPALFAEVPISATDEIRKLAADADGTGMDFDEFSKVLGARGVRLRPDKMRKMFDIADADKDGSLDRGEVETLIQELLLMMPDVDSRHIEHEEVFEYASQNAEAKAALPPIKS